MQNFPFPRNLTAGHSPGALPQSGSLLGYAGWWNTTHHHYELLLFFPEDYIFVEIIFTPRIIDSQIFFKKIRL
jgi:hypothetical protein